MGQKWTTAHMLACRDAEGELARVYHQLATDDDQFAVDERFVLGNGEEVHRVEVADIVYERDNGERLTAPNIRVA